MIGHEHTAVPDSEKMRDDFESAKALRKSRDNDIVRLSRQLFMILSQKYRHSEATLCLARMLGDGEGGQRDVKQGVALLHALGTKGHKSAQNDLIALLDKNNSAVCSHVDSVIKWCEARAENGDVDSPAILMRLYATGNSQYKIDQNDAKAEKWSLFHFASKGDANKQWELGSKYFNGATTCEIGNDLEQAHKWLRRAAEQGHTAAQYDLGLLYLNGWGTVQCRQEAKRLFECAAKQDHPDAHLQLAYIHLQDWRQQIKARLDHCADNAQLADAILAASPELKSAEFLLENAVNGDVEQAHAELLQIKQLRSLTENTLNKVERWQNIEADVQKLSVERDKEQTGLDEAKTNILESCYENGKEPDEARSLCKRMKVS